MALGEHCELTPPMSIDPGLEISIKVLVLRGPTSTYKLATQPSITASSVIVGSKSPAGDFGHGQCTLNFLASGAVYALPHNEADTVALNCLNSFFPYVDCFYLPVIGTTGHVAKRAHA